MTFQAVPDGALAVIEYGAASETWSNTFWWELAGFDFVDMSGLATALWNWAVAQVMPNLSSDILLKKVTVYDMRTQGEPIAEFASVPVAGGVAGTVNALNTALVITLRTALRGRSFRGRSYVAGFAEVDAGGFGIDDTTIADNVRLAYQNLTVPGSFQGFKYSVCSRVSAGVERPTGILTPITIVEVRKYTYGTQRRRVKRT